ncbi:hypothetical protein DPMN_090999 [Dreissena polymorpha]|uniref:Uncharacterized protein n=1 Tax=Dreissena polymorpha TaxID=45954 RepID=A0A9D4KZ78_DREPO|nr:hypothetical protein DPMN_090999 [Dreissena polymorpha]
MVEPVTRSKVKVTVTKVAFTQWLPVQRTAHMGGMHSVVPEKPEKSAQANQGQHFPLLQYFWFKESVLAKIQLRWRVLSLISLCNLHRLIRDNT